MHENELWLLWGDPLPKLATQGGPFTLPLEVYAPADDTAGLTLSITGPVEEALAEGDVKVYGDTGTDMVAMTLALDEAGNLVGTWDEPVLAGFNPVTWYVTVQDGAPVGSYTFGVALDGGNTLDHTVSVAPPAVHGEQPGAFTIAITAVGTPGSDAGSRSRSSKATPPA